MLNILFLGDIYAKPGRKAVEAHLPALRQRLKLDAVVANAENMAHFRGVTGKTLQQIYAAGVDVVTLGNHTWGNDEIETILPTDRRVLRPVNYPPGTPGEGFRVYEIAGKRLGVMSLMGRAFMAGPLDCPFRALREHFANHRLGEAYDALLIDIHAEASSEKQAIAHLADGRASLVVGSHTHVPTADAHILKGGTGFQSDAGMCGDYNSVVGATVTSATTRMEKAGNHKLSPALGEGTLCGVYAEIGEDGLCRAISPVRVGGTLAEATP